MEILEYKPLQADHNERTIRPKEIRRHSSIATLRRFLAEDLSSYLTFPNKTNEFLQLPLSFSVTAKINPFWLVDDNCQPGLGGGVRAGGGGEEILTPRTRLSFSYLLIR